MAAKTALEGIIDLALKHLQKGGNALDVARDIVFSLENIVALDKHEVSFYFSTST
jgi:hypothetical protein